MFTQPDNIILEIYNPQSINRYSFEQNNPLKYTDEDGHTIIGGQIGGEIAGGGGGGYAKGTVYHVNWGEGTYDKYDYIVKSVGTGFGGSISAEIIFGLLTTPKGLSGKGLTFQGSTVGPQGYGGGPSVSANVPYGDGDNDFNWREAYVTFGGGFSVSLFGIQAFGGESNTRLVYRGSGYWNPFMSISAQAQAEQFLSSSDSNKQSSRNGGSNFASLTDKERGDLIKDYGSEGVQNLASRHGLI